MVVPGQGRRAERQDGAGSCEPWGRVQDKGAERVWKGLGAARQGGGGEKRGKEPDRTVLGECTRSPAGRAATFARLPGAAACAHSPGTGPAIAHRIDCGHHRGRRRARGRGVCPVPVGAQGRARA